MLKEIHIGNVEDILPSLPPVQCVITSPPYWGLRDYPIEDVIIGGLKKCGHDFEAEEPPRRKKKDESGRLTKCTKSSYDSRDSYICVKCGAWKGQLGMEPDPGRYAGHLADIFNKIKLNASGLLWVNIRDSYVSGKRKWTQMPAGTGYTIKPTNLALIPDRLRLEMQIRGWYVRQTIIWRKTNPLPESVKNRLPVITEQLILFAKERHYQFNRMAVKVPCRQTTVKRYQYCKVRQSRHAGITGQTIHKNRTEGKPDYAGVERSLNDVWDLPTAGHRSKVGQHIAPMPLELARRCIALSCKPGDTVLDPFAGTGTAAAAALMENCGYIVCDMDGRLKEFTAETIKKHGKKMSPIFNTKP